MNGKSALYDKLTKELSRDGIFTESSVVYVLVLLRKLLEHGDAQQSQTLQFFCDWSLHSKLNRAGAAKLIKRFDSLIEATESLDVSQIEPLINATHELVSIDIFRDQLSDFFKQNSLPMNLTTSQQNWHDFLKSYCSVIEDSILEIDSTPARHIKTITVKNGRNAIGVGTEVDVAFTVEWHITLSDGRNTTIFVPFVRPD